MNKKVRNAFLIGLGVSLLTRDAIEQEIKQFMRQHRLTEAESRRLATEILNQGERHTRELTQKILRAEQELSRRIRRRAPARKKPANKARRTTRKR